MDKGIVDERVVGFSSEAEIWNYIGDLSARSFIIIFHDAEPKNHFSYTIRSKSNHFRTDQQYSKNLASIAQKNINEYISDGFLALQHALDYTFYENSTNKVANTAYRIELERLPAPSEKPVASNLDSIGLYIIIFSALISISLIFARIVEEKACGFREQLKNATKFSFLNNLALFSVNHVQMLSLFYVCLLITYCKGFWFSVNVFYAALLILLYVTSIISYTFLVSAFFESSKMIMQQSVFLLY